MPSPIIRPLLPDDVEPARRVATAALDPLYPPEFRPADTEETRERSRSRIAHLQQTDPDGAWVAEHDGAVVGVALGIVREGIWGLSLLGVDPSLQAAGTGRALMSAAYDCGRDARGAIILSSTHPAAMRTYFRAGFALRPCVCLAGAVNAQRLPDGLRSRAGDLEADAATLDRAARHVRGASYATDLDNLLARSSGLLVLEDRGFAIHRDGSPALLCALDEEAARDLLASCFAAAPGGTSVHVDFVMAGHDWAIEVGLDAGLALSPEGPVFTRGQLGTLSPFLPSGAYL